MISIITPTYNRETELIRAYNSLIKQTSKKFEWIIVDDGSQDETEKIVRQFKKEKKITISYIKKENGGKPSAYNLGVQKVKGELLFCLDSDDSLDKNAIEIIIKDYSEIKVKEKVAGLVYNCADINSKKIIGTSLPNNVEDTYYNIYEKYKVKGDKLQVIKASVAKEYPFPIINNEKFIPEALINNRISQKYTFLYKDDILEFKEYLACGYSANYFNLVKKNPLGNALYFREVYSLKKSWYNVYGYVLFSIYAKKKFKEIILEHNAKIKVLVLYIPVLIISKVR